MLIIIKAYEKRIAGFLFARDYPEILQRETGRIISVRGPAQDMPNFEVDYSLGYPMVVFDFSFRSTHYTGLSVEKKFIYTLYSGEKTEDISKKGKFPQTVLVFDYDGHIKNPMNWIIACLPSR